jgi:hypothetical protein
MVSPLTNIFISAITGTVTLGITMAADSPCGDWESYKDDKCFKIIDETLRNYDDAEKTCNQQENSATLVIIRSKDEQDFLSNLLFKTHKVIDNVWIGVKNTSNKFKWVDDSDLSFTNWAGGSPQNETGYDCVQMIPDISSMGKWINEPCGKKNLVVCQKMQNWSIPLLQKALLDARKFFTDSLNEEKSERVNSFNDVKKELDNLKQNPVPIGFIYVQLSGKPEPKNIWPMVGWSDVSSNYAGLFFRAVGEGSEAFGQTQGENSPRLIKADQGTSSYSTSMDIQPGAWSQYIYTGDSTGSNHRGLQFLVSSGEVRPRNQAIRIWERTK